MNENLLLGKKIRIDDLEFLHFLHPRYQIVDDLDSYNNPSPEGIIYIGSTFDNLTEKLNEITIKWIIVNNNSFDFDLTTNEGLLKNLLPLHFSVIKNSKNPEDRFIYNTVSYETLLNKIKVCLIDESKLTFDKSESFSSYELFEAISKSPGVLASTYFSIVNKDNINIVISSVLTFLNRVQSLNTRGVSSVYYSRLISQSNRLYGKHIKNAINKFLKSKSNNLISLYNMLSYLNGAR